MAVVFVSTVETLHDSIKLLITPAAAAARVLVTLPLNTGSWPDQDVTAARKGLGASGTAMLT